MQRHDEKLLSIFTSVIQTWKNGEECKLFLIISFVVITLAMLQYLTPTFGLALTIGGQHAIASDTKRSNPISKDILKDSRSLILIRVRFDVDN